MEKRGLSLIIPVYNEEESMPQLLHIVNRVLQEGGFDYEIIVVDDASIDRTPQVLRPFNIEKIKIITHYKNKGYGAAIKTGIKHSSYEYIAITDGDDSYPNEKIPDLFVQFFQKNADMTVGARVGKNVEIGIFRKFGKYILRKLAEYLTEEDILDLNSGLRIMKKELVLKFLRFLPDGFSLTATLTLFLLINNYKIIYLPIDYHKRKGKSKIKPIKDTLSFLQLILKTTIFFNPLKIFLPLSIFFIILSFTILVSTYFLGKVMDITTIITFTTGLIFLVIGILAELINKVLNK